MKRFLILLAACALVGCMRDPVSSAQTNNGQIKVDRLFDHDGCTVYRFIDREDPRYFVKCSNGEARTEWDERHQCGKTACNKPQGVPTV